MADILDLLMNGDPIQQQARQAAMLRGQQQFQNTLGDASQQGTSLNMLNFVTQNANNAPLAKSVAALNAQQESMYTPQKLDKGVFIPGTGDYVESPGVSDEKEADRQTKRLQAASVMQARTEAANSAAEARQYAADQSREGRVLAATIAASTRGMGSALADERMQLARDRFKNTKDQQDQQDTRQFGQTLQKTGLPAIADAIQGINDMFEKNKVGDIKGMGYGQETLSKIPIISDLTMGAEGKDNRSRVQKLVNAMTLTEAGKAVTQNELVRQALVNMAGDRYSEKDFRNAFSNVIVPAMEAARSNVMHQTDPGIVKQYLNNDASGYDPTRSFVRQGRTNPTTGLPTTSAGPPVLDPGVAKKYGL